MHFLVIRQSSFGDVLLAHPVIAEVSKLHPGIKFTFLSNPTYKPFFENIKNLTFFPVNTKKEFKGIRGLFKLKKEILKLDPIDGIIDLHNVLRSRILTALLPIRTHRIQKGRKEKRSITRRNNKKLHALKHTTERYSDVFNRAGIKVNFNGQPKNLPINLKHSKKAYLDANFVKSKTSTEYNKFIAAEKKKYKTLIGISLLSLQKMKCLPQKTGIEVINTLKQNKSLRIYLIGAPGEKNDLNAFCTGNNTLNIAGKFTFYEEISLFHELDLLITMDSANLHLAGLCKTPNLSIWGPTHPYTGFGPISAQSWILQREDLNCRPCSIYGNKPCYRKDFACMNRINSLDIVSKVENILKTKKI